MRESAIIVIQATAFCNLNCSYCYLADKTQTGTMVAATFEQIIKKVFKKNYAKQLRFLWHAGEPLTAKIEFFREAFEKIEKLKPDDVSIGHRLQTNATLINGKWCDLFKKYKVGVSVSIDGPAFLHDRYRVDLRGGATYQKVMRGIRILRHNQVRFGVISVVTKDTLNYPQAMFDFYVENEFNSIAFSPEEIDGCHESSSLQKVSTEKYRNFLAQFFDLVYTGGPGKLKVREFVDPLLYFKDRLKNPNYSYPRLEQEDLGIVIFTKDGHFTCFSPEFTSGVKENRNKFMIGHINDIEDMPSILELPSYQKMSESIKKGIQACAATCDYFDYCGGGSPSSKMQENGAFESTETLQCITTRKIPFELIKSKVTCEDISR